MRERGKSIEMVVLIKIGCVRLENAEQGSRRVPVMGGPGVNRVRRLCLRVGLRKIKKDAGNPDCSHSEHEMTYAKCIFGCFMHLAYVILCSESQIFMSRGAPFILSHYPY